MSSSLRTAEVVQPTREDGSTADFKTLQEQVNRMR